MLLKKFFLIFDLVFSCQGCSASTSCDLDKTIKKRAISSIYLGAVISEIEELPIKVIKYTMQNESQDIGFKATFCNGEVIAFQIDENEKVWSIRTESTNFETKSGAKVGSTFHDILKLHPDGEVVSGLEEGAYLSIYIDELGGYFSFNTETVDATWFASKEKDLDAVKNIKSFVFVMTNL